MCMVLDQSLQNYPEEPRMSTPPPPSTDTVRDPRRWLVLAVMSIGTLIVFLDGTVINKIGRAHV